jgi:hypothetical protein
MIRAMILAGASLAMLGACAQNMVTGEFWVDSDPGWGQGSAITGMPIQTDVPAQQFAVPTTALDPGMHIIGIRTKDADGHWSQTNLIPTYINAAAQTADIVRTVYFWNTDTGWNSGTDTGIDGDPSVTGTVSASMSGTTPGLNTLFVRSQDATGHWSLTNSTPVYVDPPDANTPIVRTEYFLNTDPGWGNGADAEVDGQPDVNGLVSADISGAVQGVNTLYVRSQDAHGHWSLTNTVPLMAEDSSSGIIIAAESFWDVDPGFGQGDPVQGWTPGADVLGDFDITVPFIGWGVHTLFIRSLDFHGHWSLTNWKIDIQVGTVNVEDLAALLNISTYPNPFTEGITVRTADGLPVRVVLYDPQGKLVHDKMLTGETFIHLEGQASGAYTAFFWKDLERIHRVTLIKQ